MNNIFAFKLGVKLRAPDTLGCQTQSLSAVALPVSLMVFYQLVVIHSCALPEGHITPLRAATMRDSTKALPSGSGRARRDFQREGTAVLPVLGDMTMSVQEPANAGG